MHSFYVGIKPILLKQNSSNSLIHFYMFIPDELNLLSISVINDFISSPEMNLILV